MSVQEIGVARVDRDALRRFIAEKYGEVATNPELGFHFHTGRPLAAMLGYPAAVVERLPAANVDSFAGTGNPFLFGDLHAGESVVDVGCGAGLDTLIAAQQVGPTGRVIAVDMTAKMRTKTEAGVREMGLTNVDVCDGFAESLPVDDGFADVVISNGVVNLCPDKRGLRRDAACLEARRPHSDRRHPRSQRGTSGREGRHRALERLNCWCSAGRRVASAS